jgi:hypothetical protein
MRSQSATGPANSDIQCSGLAEAHPLLRNGSRRQHSSDLEMARQARQGRKGCRLPRAEDGKGRHLSTLRLPLGQTQISVKRRARVMSPLRPARLRVPQPASAVEPRSAQGARRDRSSFPLALLPVAWRSTGMPSRAAPAAASSNSTPTAASVATSAAAAPAPTAALDAQRIAPAPHLRPVPCRAPDAGHYAVADDVVSDGASSVFSANASSRNSMVSRSRSLQAGIWFVNSPACQTASSTGRVWSHSTRTSGQSRCRD